jgi:hypothetical protein
MRIAKGIAVIMLALIVLWGGIATWLHLRGPTAEQAAALALLDKTLPPLAPDRNVADASRLQGRVVPPERRAAALEAVRRHDERLATRMKQGKLEDEDLSQDRLPDYPELPDVPESPALCERRGSTCLARVRADPAATAALLQAHSQRLQQARALADNEGYRIEREPSIYSFEVPSDDRDLVLTSFAARFAQGDTAGALADTCRDLAGWRRIGANSDQLVGVMVGAAHAEQAARLLSELVAALPADATLPGECGTALASTADAELDLCPAMGNEFAQVRAYTDIAPQTDTGLRDQVILRGVDHERMAHLLAPHFAQFCGEAIVRQSRADRPFAGRVWKDYTCPRWEFAFDPIDCILVDITAANHEHFARSLDRRMDLAAAIALLRTALWLRDTDADPRPRAQRLRERPASLGLRRDARLEGNALVIDRYDARIEKSLRLPLTPMPAPAAP